MIQIEDLRIGNFVYYGNDKHFYNVRALCRDRVHQINIVEHDGNIRYAVDCTLSDLEPIHLTADILEKAGFKWVNNYLSIDLKHARMNLAFCNGVCDKMTIFQFQGETYDSAIYHPMHFGANHPDYLHQLQNLIFALTGEELQIELLKDKKSLPK